MNSQGDVGVGSHPYHDTSSEGGVTSVITPLSIRREAGGEASLSLLIPPNKCTEGEVELFLKTKEEP